MVLSSARWLDPYETMPLVVNGVLYTMQGDDGVALDATNSRLFWIYRYYSHQRLAQSSGCDRHVLLVKIHGSRQYC